MTQKKYICLASYARNEVDDVSDIDLVVIKETHESFFDRIRNVIKILQIDRAIDILVYTPGEYEDMLQGGNAFAEMIAEEGVVIYE